MKQNIILYESKKKKRKKERNGNNLRGRRREVFQTSFSLGLAFPPKRLAQSGLGFRVAREAFIVPRLILISDKGCFLCPVECDTQ